MKVGSLPGDVRLMLFLGALALLTIFALAPAEVRSQPTSVLDAAQLTDDDGGRALFARTDLAPARPVSRCLRVSYRGSAPAAADVRLAATGLMGDLAESLRVRVEVGDGGGWTGCEGFSGGVVYDGPLPGLAAGSGADRGVPTGWRPGPDGQRTFRITATLVGGNETQGRRVTATLQWLAVTEPPAPPAGPEPTASPEPTGGPGLGLLDPSDPDPPTRTAAVDAPAPAGATGGPWRVIGAFAGQLLGHGGLPLGSLIAMLLFLLIQRRLDDRDPKLALAPMSDHPYLYFEPRGTAENRPQWRDNE